MNFRGFEPLSVIRVITKEGEGSDKDVVREVRRYFDAESGQLLWTDDPFPTKDGDGARVHAAELADALDGILDDDPTREDGRPWITAHSALARWRQAA